MLTNREISVILSGVVRTVQYSIKRKELIEQVEADYIDSKEKYMEHLNKAVKLCSQLYPLLEPLGFYPALTGGSLYKDGDRKDIDIVLYRNRQKMPEIDWDVLSEILKPIIKITVRSGFCTKGVWEGLDVDFSIPEVEGTSNYQGDDA